MSTSILIIAEHNGRVLAPSVSRTVAAARQIGADISVLVIGGLGDLSEIAITAARLDGVERVFTVEAPHLKSVLAENWTQEVLACVRDRSFTHICAAASAFGKNLLPRVAALLDVAQVSDVLAIESPTRFVRPIYAGNVWSTVESEQAVHVLTIRTTCFDPVGLQPAAPIHSLETASAPVLTRLVKQDIQEGGRPELTNARVVVSGGFALGSAENFALIEQLADKLGGAVGASRAAVDAGFVPNDCQIGQTGKVVAPELYIAVGISGQVQHLAGMKGSKVIVAINKDPEAPIFSVADYGLVADLFEALPALTAQV